MIEDCTYRSDSINGPHAGTTLSSKPYLVRLKTFEAPLEGILGTSLAKFSQDARREYNAEFRRVRRDSHHGLQEDPEPILELTISSDYISAQKRLDASNWQKTLNDLFVLKLAIRGPPEVDVPVATLTARFACPPAERSVDTA